MGLPFFSKPNNKDENNGVHEFSELEHEVAEILLQLSRGPPKPDSPPEVKNVKREDAHVADVSLSAKMGSRKLVSGETMQQWEGVKRNLGDERRGTKFLHTPPSDDPEKVKCYSRRGTTRTTEHEVTPSRPRKELVLGNMDKCSHGDRRSTSNYPTTGTANLFTGDKGKNKVEDNGNTHEHKKLKSSVNIADQYRAQSDGKRPMRTSSMQGADVDRSKLASTSAGPDPNLKHNAQANRIECDLCGKPFASSRAMFGHRSVHSRAVHVCEICHASFPSGVALGGHKRRHFNKPSQPHTTTATAGSSSISHVEAPIATAATDSEEVDLTLSLAPFTTSREVDLAAPTTSSSSRTPQQDHGKIKFNFDLNELPEEWDGS